MEVWKHLDALEEERRRKAEQAQRRKSSAGCSIIAGGLLAALVLGVLALAGAFSDRRDDPRLAGPYY